MRMKRLAFTAALAFALLPGASPSGAATPPLPPAAAEARRILEEDEQPGHVDRAIALLEALPDRDTSPEVMTLLAEAYYELGTDLNDPDKAVGALETAIVHADRALVKDPKNVRARYWRAAAMLATAGKLRGAESFGMVRAAVRELETVAAADPNLDDAGADRAMGKVYLDSPWWFMGDTDKAIEHLEAARRRAPNSLQNRRFLAEAYAEDGREADALRELQAILDMPPVPGREISTQREQELARRLADRIRARLRKP